jgi:hypothetical protein
MKVNSPERAEDLHAINGGGVRASHRQLYSLLEGVEDTPDNYAAFYGIGVGGTEPSTAPRHRHVFDQIRFVLDGEYSLRIDDHHDKSFVAYFPEGAFYGPVEIGPTVEEYTVQFGGPSGTGFPSAAQMKRGRELLEQRDGHLEKGVFVWVDEHGKTHKQDGFEALYEQVTGKPTTYPASRYEGPFIMNPENFPWVADPELPGVAWKRLGTYSERDLRIAFVRVDAGAELPVGREPAEEILFLTKGSVAYGGAVHGRLSTFATAASDPPEMLTATEPAELFYVKLHTF